MYSVSWYGACTLTAKCHQRPVTVEYAHPRQCRGRVGLTVAGPGPGEFGLSQLIVYGMVVLTVTGEVHIDIIVIIVILLFAFIVIK